MSDRQTIFSPDRIYRYTLWREWDCDSPTGCSDDLPHAHEYVQFIGLNPSTADETKDDPTIRRCIGFAKAWGYGALCMTNLFAFRATDPAVMLAAEYPIGIQNNAELCRIAGEASMVVAAWGTKGDYLDTANFVRKMMHDIGVTLYCIRTTKKGCPEHPLYLPGNLKPTRLV